MGYDIEELDLRFQSRTYYEEFEDRAELTRKIKNFKEGYYDSMATVRRRAWLMRNDKEFYKTAKRAYKQMRIK